MSSQLRRSRGERTNTSSQSVIGAEDGMEQWRARDYAAAVVFGTMVGLSLGFLIRRRSIDITSILRGVHAHRRALERAAQVTSGAGRDVRQQPERPEP
jgi:hypothetical protein